MRKSFQMTFQNAELWAASLDALGDDEDLITRRFEEDMGQILRPSSPSLIVLTLFGTVLSDDTAGLIIAALVNAGPRVRKAAFCGLDRAGKSALKKALKTHEKADLQAGIFDDTEKAKEWLL